MLGNNEIYHRVVRMERCQLPYTRTSTYSLPTHRRTGVTATHRGDSFRVGVSWMPRPLFPFVLPSRSNSTFAPHTNVMLRLGKIIVVTRK